MLGSQDFNEARASRKYTANLTNFTFIDLFAGIGGFRIGLTAAGGRPVFTNEWDNHAACTYRAWFNETDLCTRDIRVLNPEIEIPCHDVLSAGFPCQPFSIAGVSKKNSLGRPHGFSDLQQGNLFFAICDIISAKKPKVVVLENVKNLIGHDSGKTWKVIIESLELLGYVVRHEVVNAAGWVPQNRRRVFIVAFRKGTFDPQLVASFQFPVPAGKTHRLSSILEKSEPNKKYMLTDNLWKYLKKYAERHRAKGNGFGYRLYGVDDVAGTLSARYYKDGAEILIDQPNWRNPRRLTPTEAGRLMGFNAQVSKPFGFQSGFPQVVSDMQAYKQFGNSVCPLVVAEIGAEVAKLFRKQSVKSRMPTFHETRRLR